MTAPRLELIRCEECRATAPADKWDISADFDGDRWHGESICPVCRHDNGGAPEEIVVRVSVDDLQLPFCACGRVISRCDGSRRACWKRCR